MLALAQKLHEEHVAEGQAKRDALIAKGQSRHDQIIGEATARQEELLLTGQTKHDALIAEADVLKVDATAEHERIIGEARERSTGMVVAAQEKRAEVLQGSVGSAACCRMRSKRCEPPSVTTKPARSPTLRTS